MKKLLKLVCAAVAVSLAATSAQATTYYWKPGTTQGLWTTLSNWSTEPTTGADAEALPGASYSLYNSGDYNFDLDGGSYTLVSWPTPGDWNNHYLTIANGSLTFSGEVSTHSGQINVNTDGSLNFPSGSSLVLGIYTSAGMMVSANSGGSISVEGDVRLYSGSFAVAGGGSMTFAPSDMRYGADEHSYSLSLSNAGTLTLPNGNKRRIIPFGSIKSIFFIVISPNLNKIAKSLISAKSIICFYNSKRKNNTHNNT